MLKGILLKILKSAESFFFQEQPWPLLVFSRLILGLTLVFLYTQRIAATDFFSDSGWVPRAMAPQVIPEMYRLPFDFYLWPDSWNLGMQWLLVLGLLVFSVGLLPRALVFAVWYINYAFIQRNYSVIYGADVIANILLSYFIFIQPQNIFALRKWFHQKLDDFSTFGVRLIQTQMIVIYGYTGLEKMRGESWWDGTALWTVLMNPQLASFDFSFLKVIPWLVPTLCFTSILFEVYFPVLVWGSRTRLAVLAFGVFFHLGIGAFIGLGPFSAVMLSTYFLFLKPADLEWLKTRFDILK